MLKKKLIKAVASLGAAVMIVAGAGSVTTLTSYAAEFDPTYYAATYPDVAAVCGTDAQALLNHYLTYGQKEGRKPSANAQAGEAVTSVKTTTTTTTTTAATTYHDYATGQLSTLRAAQGLGAVSHDKNLDSIATNIMNTYMAGGDVNALSYAMNSLFVQYGLSYTLGGFTCCQLPAAYVSGFSYDELAPVMTQAVYPRSTDVLGASGVKAFGCHIASDAAGNVYFVFVVAG